MIEDSFYDMQEILDFLDPCDVQYQDFVVIGMALKTQLSILHVGGLGTPRHQAL